MVFEIFIVALIALKALAVIEVTWTLVAIISLAFIAVEIKLSMERKAILKVVNSVAVSADNVVAGLRLQIDGKEDRKY